MFVSVLMTPIVFPSYLSGISSSLHLPLNRLPGHPFVSPISSLNALLASLSSLFSLLFRYDSSVLTPRECYLPLHHLFCFFNKKRGKGKQTSLLLLVLLVVQVVWVVCVKPSNSKPLWLFPRVGDAPLSSVSVFHHVDSLHSWRLLIMPAIQKCGRRKLIE